MTDLQQQNFDKKRHDCWNNALHSFGYSYLYSLRAENHKKILKFNTFLGILIPIIIGGVVTTYGLDSEFLKILLVIAAPLSLIQLILSVYIVSYNIEDKYSYYLESAHDNSQIADEYEKLGKYPPQTLNELDIELDKLKIKRNNRESLDNKFPFSEKEKRKGMRYSLRNYKRSCAGCNIIPTDMIATDCGVCGQF